MKNFTNNFKQFTSRLSARWLIMALMLLLGTSSAWAVNLKGGEILYFKPNDNWKKDGARFAMFLCNGSSGDKWISMTSSVAGYYQAEVPTGDYKNIIFCRMNGGNSTNNWDNKWNQTADLTFDGTKDIFVLASNAAWDGASATWYATTKSYVLHGSFNNYTDLTFPAEVNITEGTYQFKVKETVKYNTTTITDNWYGNDGTMTRDGESVQSGGWTMELGKNDCKITADVIGNYTFTFDTSTKKVTVTYPPECNTTTFSWETAPVNMNYGETKDIVATLDPDAAGTVSYTAIPAGIVTINNNTYTAVGKGDVTITATASLNDGYCPVSDLTKSIKVTCPTPDQPKLSEGKAILDNCGDVVDGSILIENYANYGAGYTFQLDGNNVTPANDGTISVSTAKEYTVTVTNECETSNQASVTISKTTIVAPRTDFEVSISYPQVAYANNKGSINIDLSGSERSVKYYLYKDGSKVVGSEKQGEARGLRWDGIVETGTYTVKAYNPCIQGEIEIGSVEYTCMSNLNIAFAEDQTTFCPGEKTTVTITFTGTGKGDENTNLGKFGWQWTGSNYDYESVYLTESGITMPVTINANGSIQLNVKTCNGTLSSNTLNFTVVTAPEKPVLDKYSNEICTGETAEITISPYNDSYNYNLYKSEQKVETPEFDAGVFTVSEAGSYTVKAVEAECRLASAPSDPFTLTTRGTTITPSVAEIHPYEVVNFTAGEQAKWALYTNPSSGSQLSDDDAKYSGKDTAYITKGESTTTTFKGEAANGYVIHATVGDCTASYTFNVVEDPDNCQ